MKSSFKQFSFFVLALIMVNCSSSNDDVNLIRTDNVYVNYQVNGNQKSGEFNITGDHNNSKQNVYGIVVPNDDGDAVILEYVDGNQETSVDINVPAAIRSTEITMDNNYGHYIGFGFGNVLLSPKSISVTIQDIEYDSIILKYIKGSFTGNTMYTYWDSGEMIEETHSVNGSFEYNVPGF